MSHYSRFHRQRPNWWPENEPWPPQRHMRQRPGWWPENLPWPPQHRMRRHPFLRRMGCLFASFNLLGLVFLVGLIALIVRWLDASISPSDLGHILVPIAIGLIFIFALIFAFGSMGLRRLITPFDDLLKAADRVGQGDYSIHVPEKGPRAVRSLARAFNDMASRLDRLDERRRNLLADVTHELRTPLTVVQGNLEGMLDGVYPADEANLRSLLEETNLLSRLVEDLRTLALAESGALQLKREPTDMGMLVRETAVAFQAQAGSAGISLTVEAPADLPLLEFDPGRIRQVLSNLLTNALRYTPAGGTISIRYQQSDHALLEVQDSGPGIPPDELPYVFERFYKSTDSGGMGLGLAIARRLVETHGGTITAESAPGQGTRMRVVLPV